MKTKISITLNSKILKEVDSIVDNLFIRNRSQAIEYLIKRTFVENKTAVILAGGDANKLIIEKNIFRPVFNFSGLTPLELTINTLRKNNFKIIYIVGRKPILNEMFKVVGNGSEFGVKIEYVDEKIDAKGSADSLRLLKGKIKNSFLTVFCDIIIDNIDLKGLWEEHLRRKAMTTLLIATSPKANFSGGIIFMEGNKVKRFLEKPKKVESFIFFTGVFISEPEIFEYSGKSLQYHVFPKLAEKGMLYGYLSDKEHLHFHSKKDILRLEKKLKEMKVI